MKKLELIINRGTEVEFLVNLGELKTKIDIYGLNSVPVQSYKSYIQARYNINKGQIKYNWIVYQTYLLNHIEK